MASNIFSRLVPQDRGRSFYEDLRQTDPDADLESRAGIDIDEENLNRSYHDYDLDEAERLAGDESHISHSRGDVAGANTVHRRGQKANTARWLGAGVEDDVDNDVPESLLVETPRAPQHLLLSPSRAGPSHPRPTAVPGPSTRQNQAQWEATRHQQRLHNDDTMPHGPFSGRAGQGRPEPPPVGLMAGDPYEQAMWRWVNVSNLDNFIKDVYAYYRAAGFWCIIVQRILELVNAAFVAVFLTFLSQCVDYHKLPHSKKMEDIIIPKCTQNMSLVWNVGLWLFVIYFICRCFGLIIQLRQLKHLRDFYTHLLKIPGADMQSVSWQDVVGRIMALRDSHPRTAGNLTRVQRAWIGSQSKERLDAHDIANRIMRRENFMIAMLNKDVLDLTIPLPFFRNKQHMSECVVLAISFSILDFVFDNQGQVNPEFLKASRRRQLSQKLKSRFFFAGLMIFVMSPFIALYLILVYFLTYFHEFRNDPGALGARTYNSLAKWKFREFNELDHLFNDRMNMSHPFAKRYIDMFPKRKTEQVARTVSFITGSIVAVLGLATIFDSEAFLTFEITPDRSVLFYVSILATLWAVARGNISDDNEVYDPEFAMKSIIEFTHYEPDHWRGRLHSTEVKNEFSELYKPRPQIFLEEILSILLTPLVLLVSLPNSTDQIVDFFREFTIHVDGLGYVCLFSVFNFQQGHANQKQAAAADAPDNREEYYSTKHGKMAASFYGFLDHYVINPKTGLPGNQLPGSRQQFQHPPSFPGLQSPTLAADMRHSRMMRERGRSSGVQIQGSQGRTPQFRTPMPQPSPMASILLDPHHQPAPGAFGSRSMHRSRQMAVPHRGGYMSDRDIIEEAVTEDGQDDARFGKLGDEDIDESGGALDESTWQTSPTKTLSRENSGANPQETEVGVLGLIHQFQQAHMHLRR
ncbi:autophagy protein atg9 [Pyricularia oryzae]|nr:autophagy protein atg9 [Pyricularia oryzae]